MSFIHNTALDAVKHSARHQECPRGIELQLTDHRRMLATKCLSDLLSNIIGSFFAFPYSINFKAPKFSIPTIVFFYITQFKGNYIKNRACRTLNVYQQ